MSHKTNGRTEPACEATGLRLKKLSNDNSLLFYQNGHLNTTVSPHGHRHIVRVQDTALAQLERAQATKLLTSDRANSVLGLLDRVMTYSPYGHLDTSEDAVLLAFNGQWRDPRTLCYLLGSYRLFSPQLQRFCSPDSFSPFASGGLNAYSYCFGDPTNHTDNSGHIAYRIFRRLSPKFRNIKSESKYYNSKIKNLVNETNKAQRKVNYIENEYQYKPHKLLKDAVNMEENPDKYEKSLRKYQAKLAPAKENRDKLYRKQQEKLPSYINKSVGREQGAELKERLAEALKARRQARRDETEEPEWIGEFFESLPHQVSAVRRALFN
ncbi:RHS repeat-associated core domain-containing protein [Pseudomonas sp. FYR_11]|uniref:RHS repeat-associated core domain-containing protein n=1 Tax=Pseudomonas TaxID=286 RepID=UPI00370A9C9E